jgi:hypothetical protein
MKSHHTVNEVLEQLVALEGKPVQLEGILELHEEGYALKHYPKAERLSEYVEEGNSYQSGVWVEFGNGSIQPNDTVLGGWQGKRVRVHGVIHSLASLPSIGAVGKGGFGPWGVWPATIEPSSVQRVTAEERRENGA